MGADYTPGMNDYTHQGVFRFWCQKVLPLVYDDSLSYYELLCKVVNYLNNVISDVSAVETNVQNLYNSFIALQDYVNTYFENLDVSEAVKNNVQTDFNNYVETEEFKAIVDGYVVAEADEYLRTNLGDIVAAQIDEVVAAQLPEVVAEQGDTVVAPAVTNWLNANVDPVGSAVTVDKSLSISGSAGDAKVIGDNVNAIKNMLEKVVPESYVFIWETGYAINANTGEKYSTEYFSASDYILIGDTEKIIYSRLAVPVTRPLHGIAFYNAEKEFISGEISIGESETSTMVETVTIIPENAVYARYTKRNAETNPYYAYKYEQYYNNMEVSLNENTETLAWVKKQSDETNILVRPTTLDFKLTDGEYIKYADGTSAANVNFSYTDYIDISGITKIRYKRCCVSASNPMHGMAFYNSEKQYISGVQSGKNYPESTTIYYDVDVPENAKYARFTYWLTSVAATIGEFAVYNVEQMDNALTVRVNILENTTLNITHEMPPSTGYLNVIRRCRQFTDIKWTPAKDLPRRCQMSVGSGAGSNPAFEDVFKAGIEYTGIPYARATRNASNWGYNDMKVGFTVGFETFISAVMNEESVVCRASVYDAVNHNACFYATVCAALCSYAYNLDRYYTATQLPNVNGMSRIDTVENLELEDLKLCDMLLDPDVHGAIITDFIKDKEGNVTYIEISEATTLGNDNWNVTGTLFGGVCRRKMWSVTDFRAKWNGYGIYRYAYIDTVTYTKSPYVDTGNEGDVNRAINFPIIPYMGDGFHYKYGHIASTKLLTPAYRSDSVNKLRVLKDGEPWNVDTTTNYYDVSGNTITVGFSEKGTYSAYLCQVEDNEEIIKTRPCTWYVED